MSTESLLAAAQAHLRIHQISDFDGTIADVLARLLAAHGVRSEAEATRRLALFAGDIAE